MMVHWQACGGSPGDGGFQEKENAPFLTLQLVPFLYPVFFLLFHSVG